jgi:uncharacterized membrane protein (UPF0127 family)
VSCRGRGGLLFLAAGLMNRSSYEWFVLMVFSAPLTPRTGEATALQIRQVAISLLFLVEGAVKNILELVASRPQFVYHATQRGRG